MTSDNTCRSSSWSSCSLQYYSPSSRLIPPVTIHLISSGVSALGLESGPCVSLAHLHIPSCFDWTASVVESSAGTFWQTAGCAVPNVQYVRTDHISIPVCLEKSLGPATSDTRTPASLLHNLLVQLSVPSIAATHELDPSRRVLCSPVPFRPSIHMRHCEY